MNPEMYRRSSRPIWKQNLWNYFISFGAIGVGILFQMLILFSDWPENRGGAPGGLTDQQFAISFFIFHFIGFYGIWRIQVGHKFSRVLSRLPVAKKLEKLKIALEPFNLAENQFNRETIHFIVKGFLMERFKVVILIDDEYFYVNTENVTIDFDGGFIDLGASFRVTKKIIRRIKKYL